MNTFYEIVGIASGSENLMEVAEKEGVRVYEVEMIRTISPLKDLAALWKLFRFFYRERPSIVHSHTPKAGFLAMTAAWLCRIPVRLHTVAGLPLMEAKGIKRRILESVERVTYGFATKVYANSSGLYSHILENRYCAASKVDVIGNGSSNGVDTDFFRRSAVSMESLRDIRKQYMLGETDFVFIYVGRLVAEKGIHELVEAFGHLYLKNPKARLLLVGSEEIERDPLEKHAKEILESHRAIIKTGWVSDVRPFLSVANVLVLPSYREGLPNVSLQACAMDIPCIVTNIPGCNEVISDGYNGLLIPPKNSIELLEAMREILIDEDLYSNLVVNARRSVSEKYEQKQLWGMIKAVYDDQLSQVGH